MNAIAPRRLEPLEVAAALVTLPDWALVNATLCRTLKFADFAQAFEFMTKVAALAEEMHHHPDWSNAYNRVHIALTTHDCEGISPRDVELAHGIDTLLATHPAA